MKASEVVWTINGKDYSLPRHQEYFETHLTSPFRTDVFPQRHYSCGCGADHNNRLVEKDLDDEDDLRIDTELIKLGTPEYRVFTRRPYKTGKTLAVCPYCTEEVHLWRHLAIAKA